MAVNLSPFSREHSIGSARIGEKYAEVFQGHLASTSKSAAEVVLQSQNAPFKSGLQTSPSRAVGKLVVPDSGTRIRDG